MKKRAFTWWQMAIVLAGLAIIAAVLFPMFGRARECCAKPSCQSHLKQIGLGIKQYLMDYDQSYPPVNSGKDGWMNSIMPYVKSTQIFQCPDEPSSTVNTNDYFYNAQLSGLAERKLTYIANTIMNGDGIPDSPTDANLAQFPASWNTDTTSPAWRHREGANYSFADGHVKWIMHDQVSNEKPSSSEVTFAVG